MGQVKYSRQLQQVLQKVNFPTITKLFDSYLFLLWLNGVQHDDLLLSISCTKLKRNFYQSIIFEDDTRTGHMCC